MTAKVLIVDDDERKTRRLVNFFTETLGCDISDIQNVTDAVSAREILKTESYDLLLLDIVIPVRADGTPESSTGVGLLREIMQRDIYIKPKYVVGLTAYPEALEEASVTFSDYLWVILEYEIDSLSWQEPIRRLVSHIELSERANGKIETYSADICIVTALEDPELSALLRLNYDWATIEIPTDQSTYYQGIALTKEGNEVRVIAASALQMGMVSSAVLSTKMITSFRPRFLCMIGICAGIQGEVNLGDALVADPCWDFQSGKIKEGKFEISPYQISPHPAVKKRFLRIAKDREVLNRIKREWPSSSPQTELCIHIGPFVSGSSVVSDPSITEDVIASQHRKLIGLDMEAYGVFLASNEASLPQPFVFSVKSVCDFADENKNDDHQNYAAYTSSRIIAHWVENYYDELKSILPI